MALEVPSRPVELLPHAVREHQFIAAGEFAVSCLNEIHDIVSEVIEQMCKMGGAVMRAFPANEGTPEHRWKCDLEIHCRLEIGCDRRGVGRGNCRHKFPVQDTVVVVEGKMNHITVVRLCVSVVRVGSKKKEENECESKTDGEGGPPGKPGDGLPEDGHRRGSRFEFVQQRTGNAFLQCRRGSRPVKPMTDNVLRCALEIILDPALGALGDMFLELEEDLSRENTAGCIGDAFQSFFAFHEGQKT